MNSISLREAVRVDPRPDAQQPVLDLIDDIQGIRVQLSTSQQTQPTRCSTDLFRFPVDVAYELPPVVLWTHTLNPVIVRDSDGTVCANVTYHEAETFPPGQYSTDICSLGLKIYLQIDGEMDILSDDDRGRVIDCSAAESVRIGLRSLHESPATTVTTTDDPRDIMRAFSCLGSALKTTSCERSYPTLRGHPPLVERGERFHAPADLERTEETASVRIEVPPTLESVYPVASLAYYLNAVVRPGGSPRLVTADTTYHLDRGNGVEHGVTRLLKHVFTLDCITRTEGLFPVTLGEWVTLEDRLADTGIEVDFADLYERSLAEQVERYVSIPFDLVADLVPRWPLTADVRPVAKYLPYLPFIADSLGEIRCLQTSQPRSSPSDPPEIEAFCRDSHSEAELTDFTRNGDTAVRRWKAATRSPGESSDTDLSSDVHSAPESDSIAQIWLADGYPILGAKPTLAAFQRRFDATEAETYEVAVVSNDPAMGAESDVVELYGQRERIPFDVTIHEQLSCEELRGVLAEEHDLVHYVGHVDSQGLQCTDGWLDAHTLDTVEARMFILNGCRSYEQGMALVETGAIGGLCTLTNVGNTPATQIGRTVARLLNEGFSLAGALDLIGEDSLTGQQYMIVGNPRIAIVQYQNDTSICAEITSASDDDDFVVDIYGYPSVRSTVGMLYTSFIDDSDTYYLNSGHITSVTVSRAEVAEYLHHDRFPIRINRSLTWSDVVTIDSIE